MRNSLKLDRAPPWGTGGGIDYKYHLKFLANAVNCSESSALEVETENVDIYHQIVGINT